MLQKNSYIYEEYIFSSHQHTLKGDTYLGGWVGGGVKLPSYRFDFMFVSTLIVRFFYQIW